MQGIRSRAADAVCPKSGGCVTSSVAIGLPLYAALPCRQGIECVKQWLVFWQNFDEYLRTRETQSRAAPRQELPLAEGSGLTKAVMCVLFDAGWFLVHHTNWKQAGGNGVYWSFTGVGD